MSAQQEPAASSAGAAGALEARLEALQVGEHSQQHTAAEEAAHPPLLRPGSTVPRHAAPPEESFPPPAAPPVEHAWGPASASEFAVRAARYKKLGRKEPSLEAFYELVTFDFVQTPQGPVDHIARGMDLSALVPPATHPDLPPLFVVNCELPDAEPPAMAMFGGGAADDGPARSAVFVFAVRADTVAALNKGGGDSLDPALQLLVEYFRRAPTDADFRGRFKVIAQCANLEELALPSFIANYNGKPVLITKSGQCFQGPNHTYAEMSIRVHRFSFLARKGLAALQSRFGSMDLLVAFVVEARAEEEQPERLLGCARLHRLAYQRAAPASMLPMGVLLGGSSGNGASSG